MASELNLVPDSVFIRMPDIPVNRGKT
ncbi:protein of unknown function (plasmid) [Caballeronia sp. S22]